LNELHSKPPEVLSGKGITGQAVGDTPHRIFHSLIGHFYTVSQVPAGIRPLVESCSAFNLASRPSFLQVLQAPVFQSMQMKALRYIDVLLTRIRLTNLGSIKAISSYISHALWC
jgi:hypothetical protein